MNCSPSTSWATTRPQKQQTIGTLMNGSQGNTAEWKQPVPNGYKLYNYIYITFLKYENYRDEEQMSNYQELRMGEGVGVGTKG